MVSLPICQATLRLGVGGMKAGGGGECNGERERERRRVSGDGRATESEWRWGERRRASGDGRESGEKVSSRIFSISSIIMSTNICRGSFSLASWLG